MKFFYIILENKTILSKKKYADWKEIQNDYTDYKASLGPWTYGEICDYFSLDYSDEQDWPFSKKTIIDFLDSDSLTIECVD